MRQIHSILCGLLIVVGLCINDTTIQAQLNIREVRSVAWSPDGALIAVALGPYSCDIENVDSSLYKIKIIDAEIGVQINEFEGHTCTVNSVAWSPDGQLLASASSDGTAKVWNLDGEIVTELQNSRGFYSEVTGIAWSPDGSKIANYINGPGRSPLFIWDAVSGEQLQLITGGISSVDWNADGTQLAIGRVDSTVQILDATTPTFDVLESFQALERGRIVSVDWSPDGAQLAVSGIDLRIFDVANNDYIEFAGHADNSVYSVRWNSDGTQIASHGGLDNNVRIWDVETSEQLYMIETEQHQLFSFAWSSDDTQLAIGTIECETGVAIVPSNETILEISPFCANTEESD